MKLPIAIVTETMNYVSGGVRCIVEVLNRLQRRGCQTACYVTQPDLCCEWLGVEFPILPVSRLREFKGIAISPYSPTAEIVARSNAIGKFYWVHSYEPKFPELTGRSDRWRVMSENSYRFDELQYFTVSSYVKMILEIFYQRNVLSPLVPGGVDTDLFKPDRKKGDSLKLMFLSRENAFRGARDIVKALHILNEQGIDLDVYAMGKPLDMGNLNHRLLPQLPQIEFADLLGSMDIFVHASHFEGLPLPPLEAMACRCAVVATYVGASDYLLDGYNALVVPPGRPDKIAAALTRLAKDPDLRCQLGDGGFKTVCGGYTWEHTVDRLEEALAEGMVYFDYEARQAQRVNALDTLEITTSENIISDLRETGPKPFADAGACRLNEQNKNECHLPISAGKDFRELENDADCESCRVSAIVSTYNAERFIGHCLEDLLSQTIADQLEIIVVDSGSQENEAAVVRKFQAEFKIIKYLKSERRESVYAAWNRGIKIASGKYITNANADDRHAPYALERMAGVLDEKPDIALVYADVWLTEIENQTFDNFTPAGRFKWKDFDPATLINGCYIGPQPMWRKAVHKRHGYFDEAFESAGDWEFWLRISQTEKFWHIKECLGLYLKSPRSIEHRDYRLSSLERVKIRRMYAKTPIGGITAKESRAGG